VMIDVISIL